MFKNEPDLLTRKRCQELLKISKSKMLEFIHNGYIPAIIIAGSYFPAPFKVSESLSILLNI